MASAASLRLTRQFWVVAHRWAGLTLALFLIVVGFTGALLPWNEPLTLLARPSLSRVAPVSPRTEILDGITLAERVERETGGRVEFIRLDIAPDRVAILSVGPRPGRPLGYDTVWADPYTGEIRLKYRDGVLADGPQAVMSFLYSVHRELALGTIGQYMLGVAALIWTIDCFVGFYLTLPVRRRSVPGKPMSAPGWWPRWRPAWLVRWRSGRHKLTFDLHRAGGLWVWPILFVFAWSSVGLNLREVHTPVMRLFGAMEPADIPARGAPLPNPPITTREALSRGDRLLREIGRRRGFTVVHPGWISYDAGRAAYRYNVRSSRDVMTEGGRTAVSFSGIDGRLLAFDPPFDANLANSFTMWLYMLHFAQVFGLPYRIFVSAMGLLTAMLSVTGVLIWMKKRSARLLSQRSLRPMPVRREPARVPIAAE